MAVCEVTRSEMGDDVQHSVWRVPRNEMVDDVHALQIEHAGVVGRLMCFCDPVTLRHSRRCLRRVSILFDPFPAT